MHKEMEGVETVETNVSWMTTYFPFLSMVILASIIIAVVWVIIKILKNQSEIIKNQREILGKHDSVEKK